MKGIVVAKEINSKIKKTYIQRIGATMATVVVSNVTFLPVKNHMLFEATNIFR